MQRLLRQRAHVYGVDAKERYNEPINQDKELKKISDHDIIIIKQKKNGGQIYGRANNIYSRVQEQNSD